MNDTTHAMHEETLATEPDPQTETVSVWDPLVRLFHWSLAGSFFVAYLSEDDWLDIHVWAGYVALGLIAFRLVWGLVGPQHARWSDFVKSPAQILAYLKDVIRFKADRHLGHNPAGGAMVVALMASVAATGLTGLALYGAQELSGPLAPMLGGLPAAWGNALEDAHELLANLTLGLVVLHLCGVLFASLQHRENLVRSMFNGKKRR